MKMNTNRKTWVDRLDKNKNLIKLIDHVGQISTDRAEKLDASVF